MFPGRARHYAVFFAVFSLKSLERVSEIVIAQDSRRASGLSTLVNVRGCVGDEDQIEQNRTT